MPKFETPTIQAAIPRQTGSKLDQRRLRDALWNTSGSMEIPLRDNEIHNAADPPELAIISHLRRLLSARELAEMLGVSLSWVNKSHVYGTGPPATRVGRRRLYDPVDVQHWLATRKQRHTSERTGELDNAQ